MKEQFKDAGLKLVGTGGGLFSAETQVECHRRLAAVTWDKDHIDMVTAYLQGGFAPKNDKFVPA